MKNHQLVHDYLVKIREGFVREENELDQKIQSDKLLLQENMRFLAMLEGSLDASIEAFSPRNLNQYQKEKVTELKTEQKNLIESIESLDAEREAVLGKITEIDEVIASV